MAGYKIITILVTLSYSLFGYRNFYPKLLVFPRNKQFVCEQSKRADEKRCFGSGFALDPDSIRSMDPYSGGQKRATKIEKKLRNVMF
jgi:hypothetical protein